MERYVPPFTVTLQMMKQVAEIAEKIGKISNYRSFETKPHLRRNNRIRSVWSSVAIEANSLSLDEVRSVINGKTVIGPEKDIQEVKNASGCNARTGGRFRIRRKARGLIIRSDKRRRRTAGCSACVFSDFAQFFLLFLCRMQRAAPFPQQALGKISELTARKCEKFV